MYTVLTSIFAKPLLALFLVSTSLSAEPTLPAKPTSFDASFLITKANRVRLAVDKTTDERLKITLHQAGKSDALFFRQIGRRQTKVTIQFDVDQLTDGTYELEIRSASGCIVKQFNLGTTPPLEATPRLLAIQ